MPDGAGGHTFHADARAPGPRMRAARKKDRTWAWIGVAAFVSVAMLSWWWFALREDAALPAITPAPVAQPAAEPPPTPREPVIRHPVEPAAAAVLPALDQSDGFVISRLRELLGRRTADAMIVGDGIVRRFAATVDNLARDHAPASMWPVVRAPGRFTVEQGDSRSVIADANARRYARFVGMLEGMDPMRAASVYTGLYPLVQQGYEELGFPDGHFNDRLVDVIDHLLRTPIPQGPVEVRLVDVRGPATLTAPWLHYEFVDPQLEALSAGQKLLLRMGPENARRVTSWLTAFRAALVR